MFSGLQIKLIIGLIIATVFTGGYFYMRSLQSDLRLAKKENLELQSVIRQQTLVIEKNKQDIKKMQEVNKKVGDDFAKSQQQVAELNAKFEKFTKVIRAKPTETEKRVNRATSDALRCNEIITGSPLKNQERQATYKNSICQDVIDALIEREKANAQ